MMCRMAASVWMRIRYNFHIHISPLKGPENHRFSQSAFNRIRQQRAFLSRREKQFLFFFVLLSSHVGMCGCDGANSQREKKTHGESNSPIPAVFLRFSVASARISILLQKSEPQETRVVVITAADANNPAILGSERSSAPLDTGTSRRLGSLAHTAVFSL